MSREMHCNFDPFFFRNRFGLVPPENWHCRIWTSPYKRTRETSQLLIENSGGWITDMRENVFLVEQQFGLFEGVDWGSGQLDNEFPNELNFYNVC